MKRMRLFLLSGFLLVGAMAATAADDTRGAVLDRLFACYLGKPCTPKTIAAGSFLNELQQHLPLLLKQQKVLAAGLVPKLPSMYHRKYERQLGRLHNRLKKAGYNVKEVHQIGLGKAVIPVGPDVSLALASVTTTREKGRKDHYFYLVLWKTKAGWRIHYADDFPGRWMSQNKPPSMQ